MKKFICTALTLAMVVGSLAGCGSSSSKETTAASGAATEAATEAAAAGDFDTSKEISVNSREDGSGTRGAFIELFGVEEKAADGTKVDNTTVEANITNSTAVMMTSVAGDPYAIGYISLGSLNDTVKAAKIDGAEATTENVANGTYKMSRPFVLATKGEATGAAGNFIKWIKTSSNAKKIITKMGFVNLSQVKIAPRRIKLNVKSKITLKKGKKKTIKYTVYPANAVNKAVKFKSSNKKVATVSKKGVIKAKKKGKATITITTVEGNVKAKIKVTVKKK